MPLSLGKIILLKENGGMRESMPWNVDKKSRVPKEEKGAQGPQEVERSLRLSRRRKGQTFFFSTFLCILLKDMFLLNKNLLTNLVILKLVYCGSGSGKIFLLLVLILSS